MARGVADPAGQPVDTLAVDEAVGDQAHRPPGDVGGDVPLGAAGRRVGQAALAGAEAGGVRARCGGVERDVARRGGPRRARGPAVDAGGPDCGVEHPVEAAVPAADGAVAGLGVEVPGRCHDPSLSPGGTSHQRKSDTAVGGQAPRDVCRAPGAALPGRSVEQERTRTASPGRPRPPRAPAGSLLHEGSASASTSTCADSSTTSGASGRARPRAPVADAGAPPALGQRRGERRPAPPRAAGRVALGEPARAARESRSVGTACHARPTRPEGDAATAARPTATRPVEDGIGRRHAPGWTRAGRSGRAASPRRPTPQRAGRLPRHDG